MIEMRRREVYRYLGYRNITPSPEIDARIQTCIGRMQTAATPRAILRRCELRLTAPDQIDIAGLCIHSRDLFRNLSGCDYAYMYAATIGLGIDHLIKRGEVSSMTDSIIYQAAGAAMIEAFADHEMESLRAQEAANAYRLRPRYSPGYGDLPLALQLDFARILDMQKWCGITLTDALLMVPSKSITAFIGCTKDTAVRKDADYLASVINPLTRTGKSAAEAAGLSGSRAAHSAAPNGDSLSAPTPAENEMACGTKAPGEHHCSQCRKSDCLYRE